MMYVEHFVNFLFQLRSRESSYKDSCWNYTPIFWKYWKTPLKVHRLHGGQKERYKDTLNSSPKTFNIDHNSWDVLSAQRDQCSQSVHNDRASTSYKGSSSKTSTQREGNPCHQCCSALIARIGLISLLRTHRLNYMLIMFNLLNLSINT